MRKQKLTVCKTCGYPHAGASCGNPACFANPKIDAETKASWRARSEILEKERRERERIRKIREKSMRGNR